MPSAIPMRRIVTPSEWVAWMWNLMQQECHSGEEASILTEGMSVHELSRLLTAH